MNKEELIEQVAASTKQSKQATRDVLDSLFAVVGDSLAEGHNVELRGFGSFKVKDRRERTARNPKTGETVKTPRRLVPVFKPSTVLNGKLSGR